MNIFKHVHVCAHVTVQIIFIETGRTALLVCITKLQYTMLKQGFLNKKKTASSFQHESKFTTKI